MPITIEELRGRLRKNLAETQEEKEQAEKDGDWRQFDALEGYAEALEWVLREIKETSRKNKRGQDATP